MSIPPSNLKTHAPMPPSKDIPMAGPPDSPRGAASDAGSAAGGSVSKLDGSRMHSRSMVTVTPGGSVESMVSMHADEHPPRGMRSYASSLFRRGDIVEEADSDDLDAGGDPGGSRSPPGSSRGPGGTAREVRS